MFAPVVSVSTPDIFGIWDLQKWEVLLQPFPLVLSGLSTEWSSNKPCFLKWNPIHVCVDGAKSLNMLLFWHLFTASKSLYFGLDIHSISTKNDEFLRFHIQYILFTKSILIFFSSLSETRKKKPDWIHYCVFSNVFFSYINLSCSKFRLWTNFGTIQSLTVSKNDSIKERRGG